MVNQAPDPSLTVGCVVTSMVGRTSGHGAPRLELLSHGSVVAPGTSPGPSAEPHQLQVASVVWVPTLRKPTVLAVIPLRFTRTELVLASPRSKYGVPWTFGVLPACTWTPTSL